MAKAIFNGVVVAESDQTEIVEGNHYFPPASVKTEYFAETERHTTCPWKGVANYYTLSVDGQSADNAAWTYPTPKDAAGRIKDYIAFYGNKVTIED